MILSEKTIFTNFKTNTKKNFNFVILLFYYLLYSRAKGQKLKQNLN